MATRAQNLVSSTNAWRDAYSPLRGLTMARAVSLLESLNLGSFADLMWTYKHIEETDPCGIALVERGLSALEELDYDVKMATEEKHPNTWDEKLAEDQRAYLAARYEQLDNLNEVVAHLALGFFRKYAFGQVIENTDGTPCRIECLDQWNFARDGLKGAFYWNPKALSVSHRMLGDPLDRRRDRLVIMEHDRHVDRYGLIKFLRANLAEKDWDSFVEVFGFDQTVVILPDGIPQDKMADYLAAAEKIANGGNAALPSGSTIDRGNATRGSQPFRPRLDWLQEQHVLAGTAGLLTMLTAAGSGTLAGGAHADTWKTLSRARGKRISEVLQQDFDRPELAKAFPGKPVLAYFSLAANEEQDVGDVVGHAVSIRQAFPTKTMDPDQFTEKTAYRLVDVPADAAYPAAFPSGAPGSVRARSRLGRLVNRFLGRTPGPADRQAQVEVQADRTSASLEAAAKSAFGAAVAKDLQPIIDRINAALALPDDEMVDELIAIYNEAPDVLQALATDSHAAPVLADTITSFLVNGVAETVKAHGVES